MTEFMGELICELAPASTSGLKEDRERFFKGRTKESYRTVVYAGRSSYYNAPRWRFPEHSREMAGDVRQQGFNVRGMGTSPIASDYCDIHTNDLELRGSVYRA